MNKRILITGANSGLGKEAARQLALSQETEKIYLACRNIKKAETAKISLERSTKKFLFEILIMDVSDPDSVRTAISKLKEPVDALIMNAGGMGGKDPLENAKSGGTHLFTNNLLGHVVMLHEMIDLGKLKNVALYAGSEGARGVDEMGMAKPSLTAYSVEEISSIIDGTFFDQDTDPMQAYGYVKYLAALWMASEARKNPDLRLITVSPGFTKGTAVMNDLTLSKRIMFKYIMIPIIAPLKGMVHSLQKGAKRFVDGITDPSFKTGIFYASKPGKLVGPVIDQSTIFPDLNRKEYQDNASEAIRRYIN